MDSIYLWYVKVHIYQREKVRQAEYRSCIFGKFKFIPDSLSVDWLNILTIYFLLRNQAVWVAEAKFTMNETEKKYFRGIKLLGKETSLERTSYKAS